MPELVERLVGAEQSLRPHIDTVSDRGAGRRQTETSEWDVNISTCWRFRVLVFPPNDKRGDAGAHWFGWAPAERLDQLSLHS
jgi:hypothetical protein